MVVRGAGERVGVGHRVHNGPGRRQVGIVGGQRAGVGHEAGVLVRVVHDADPVHGRVEVDVHELPGVGSVAAFPKAVAARVVGLMV